MWVCERQHEHDRCIASAPAHGCMRTGASVAINLGLKRSAKRESLSSGHAIWRRMQTPLWLPMMHLLIIHSMAWMGSSTAQWWHPDSNWWNTPCGCGSTHGSNGWTHLVSSIAALCRTCRRHSRWLAFWRVACQERSIFHDRRLVRFPRGRPVHELLLASGLCFEVSAEAMLTWVPAGASRAMRVLCAYPRRCTRVGCRAAMQPCMW